MAHLKFKFETLNAFCNEAFEKFGLQVMKAKQSQMYYYCQTYMELSHMVCSGFHGITKGLKKA